MYENLLRINKLTPRWTPRRRLITNKNFELSLYEHYEQYFLIKFFYYISISKRNIIYIDYKEILLYIIYKRKGKTFKAK